MAPIGIELEGERIDVAGHIAGDARIAVLAPGAADALRLFQDDEVVDALLLQLNAHADAGHARAENGHAHGVFLRGRSRPFGGGCASH